MAHQAQRNFVRRVQQKFPQFFKDVRVLDIGSLNINGTLRDFFQNADYIGVDVGAGPGVDVVCYGEDYDSLDQFDVTCSAECFEHNPKWFETFQNMIRLTESGGLVFFTCATTGRPEHGTTRTTPQDAPLMIANGHDYYQNLTEGDFRSKMDFDATFVEYGFDEDRSSCDLYFWGVKR